MPDYLFTTLPSNDLGLLTRSLPIAAELRRQGGRVAFCHPADAPARLIAEAGFENRLPAHPFFALRMSSRPDLAGLWRQASSAEARQAYGGPAGFMYQVLRALPTRLAPGRGRVWNLDHFWAGAGMLNERFVRAGVEAFGPLVAECDLVVDCWNPLACIAARAASKPLATVIQADVHPASSGFIWWRPPPADWPSPVPVVNRVLADLGLAPIASMAELSLGDLTLVLGTPETDPLPETAEVVYVGPILWQQPGAELPGWIDELDPTRPLVWLYAGNPRYLPIRSWADGEPVLRACLAALAGEPVQVVLSTGHHALPAGLRRLPPNARHAPFVPGLAMAERSDLLVHHGGYGSCQTGLACGTPAVIIPTYSERESNARRVAALGAGEVVLPAAGQRQVRPEQIRAAVRRVLGDRSYAANARRASELLRSYGGAAAAAELIQGRF